MRRKSFKHLIDICKTENSNTILADKPYRSLNLLTHNIYLPKQIHATEVFAQQIPVEELPAIEAPPVEIPVEEILEEAEDELEVETPSIDIEEITEFSGETGYISVGVFTALGALPVSEAVVTVYYIDEETGDENIVSHLITDANGRVPDIELPVVYDEDSPLASSKYYFTTYNLRVQADNYYTVNILEVRIFPDVTTNYRIDLIPVIAGEPGVAPEQTFVIPPSPLDISNV